MVFHKCVINEDSNEDLFSLCKGLVLQNISYLFFNPPCVKIQLCAYPLASLLERMGFLWKSLLAVCRLKNWWKESTESSRYGQKDWIVYRWICSVLATGFSNLPHVLSSYPKHSVSLVTKHVNQWMSYRTLRRIMQIKLNKRRPWSP